MKSVESPALRHRRIEDTVKNLVRLSEKRFEPCFSDFLTDSEQTDALEALRLLSCERFMMWGGFESAQRKMLGVFPEYTEASPDAFPFEALHLRFRPSAGLTHRDFLGALMACGITRDSVGDIAVSEGAATFFVKSELVPYIEAQIDKIGREGVTFAESGVDLSSLKQQFRESTGTVSSLRLDCVIGECTGVSRTKAVQIIKSGAAMVNSAQALDGDKRLSDGDVISVRGFGKYIVHFDGSMSKKGRYRIAVSKYL